MGGDGKAHVELDLDGSSPAQAHSGQRRRRPVMAVIGAVVGLGTAAGAVLWLLFLRQDPGPVGLTAVSIQDTSVSLRWAPPPGRDPVQAYVVRRDGTPIAHLEGATTYTDTGLTPLSRHLYTIAATRHGQQTGATPDLVVQTLPASPRDLRTSQVATTSLVLAWSAPPGPAPRQYVIQRDHADLATVDGSQLSYHDSGLLPDTNYRYTVIALTVGQRSAAAPPATFLTARPPLAEARLSGGYQTYITVTDTHGGAIPLHDRLVQTWSITPTCPTGPCPITVTATLGRSAFPVTLTGKAGHYQGSAPASLLHCGTVDWPAQLDINLTPTSARAYGGQWTATAWTATLHVTADGISTPAGYCTAQQATFTADATLT